MTKSDKTDSKTAFIIGNGLSRQDFDLNRITVGVTVYGCNALYRDYTPDYLVAIDPPIIEEINNSDFPKDRFIVPPYHEQFENPKFHGSNMPPRSNAGTNAILEAIKAGHNQLVCLGFDFLIADQSFSTANVYDDTVCYEAQTRASYTDNINRAKYLEWICNRNRHVKFIMVYPRGKFVVHGVNAPNIKGIFYDMIDEYL